MSRPPPAAAIQTLFLSSTRHHLSAALIFLVCAGTYFLTRTPALDEWDSVQFALGVGDFDMARHQPHPPGYPLYIAAGWLMHHVLPLAVPDALQLVSALGGGLFVACWFVLIARRFGTLPAWAGTAALATLLVTWMTATKALTDPAGAGLLALTLLCADTSRRAESDRWLAAAAAAGAADVGVRPQNVGVVLLILVLTILAVPRPSRRARWQIGVGTFLGVGLLWLLPTMFVQAHTHGDYNGWLAYPRLLLAQWRWRLNQPKAFVGAEGAGGEESIWLYRADHHLLGLLTRGFGFALGSVRGWLGVAVLVVGWTFYARRDRVRGLEADDAGRGGFWVQHLPWAGVYYLTVFCFLPGDQRYYLPIFPLLILPAVLGWQTVSPGRPWLAAAVPLATLAATLPFIGPNHTQPAPPVQMIRWLQTRYPPAARGGVHLILRDGWRHGQWYAPDFQVVNAAGFVDAAQPLPPGEVCTDDPAVVARFPAAGWRRVATFRRSPLIYRKHNTVELFRVEQRPAAVGNP